MSVRTTIPAILGEWILGEHTLGRRAFADPVARRPRFVGHRHAESWRVDVLDTGDQVVGGLDGVMSGSLDYSIHTEIRSSGSLTVAEPQRYDWHRIRLQVWYTFRDEAGTLFEYPLGVFLPTTPATSYDDTGPVAEVAIYDKMTLLSQDATAGTWSADKGVSVVDAVTEVLESVGETAVVGPDDGGGNLRTAMVWEAGTPKLRVVNDILEAGNFFSIWVDGGGVWRLDPYIAPTSRGVEWTHEAGENAIFEAEFEHEADGWDIPNVVVMVGKAETDENDEEEPAPFAEARNEDVDDPFSIPSRGRRIVLREEDTDATSAEVLGGLAARRLLEVSSVTSTYEIAHAWLPLDLNAAVRLRHDDHDIDALCVLQAWSWSWDADGAPGSVGATLREVKE